MTIHFLDLNTEDRWKKHCYNHSSCSYCPCVSHQPCYFESKSVKDLVSRHFLKQQLLEPFSSFFTRSTSPTCVFLNQRDLLPSFQSHPLMSICLKRKVQEPKSFVLENQANPVTSPHWCLFPLILCILYVFYIHLFVSIGTVLHLKRSFLLKKYNSLISFGQSLTFVYPFNRLSIGQTMYSMLFECGFSSFYTTKYSLPSCSEVLWNMPNASCITIVVI